LAETEDTARREWWRKPVVWVLGIVASTIIGLLITAAWNKITAPPPPPPPPPPLADQKASLRTELAQGPNEVLSFEEVDLRDDIPVFVVAVGGEKERYYADRSDVVYVYDFVHGRLKRQATFTPPEQTGYRFATIDTERDLDGNDVDDFLGAFSIQTEDRSFQYPFVISFDDESSSYSLVPVIEERPVLRAPEGFFAEIHHEAYGNRVQLGTTDAGPIYSYAVGNTTLVDGSGNVLLVADFLQATPEVGDWMLETRAWGFYGQEDSIGAAPCRGSFLVKVTDHIESDIHRIWDGRFC
jgi:hypothetical protein